MPVFPRIKGRDPYRMAGAHGAGWCMCYDSCEYVLKDGVEGVYIPHSEYFCHRLANIIGIATPIFSVVEQLGSPNQFFFGSRYQAGSDKRWIYTASIKQWDFDSIKPALSRVFAFDHFVLNVDRSADNFLVYKQQESCMILAIDFAGAWFCNGFPPNRVSFKPSDQTLQLHSELKDVFSSYLLIDDMNDCLDDLARVNCSEINSILDGQHETWLTDIDKNRILDWWGSKLRLERIESVRREVTDGKYF